MKPNNDKPKEEKPKLTKAEVEKLQDKAVNKVGKVICK